MIKGIEMIRVPSPSASNITPANSVVPAKYAFNVGKGIPILSNHLAVPLKSVIL